MTATAGQTVIVGSGLAGLLAALSIPGPCLLATAGVLGGDTSSGWAQGGIAAAVGTDDDVLLHQADTVAAGDGLCDPDAVRRIVSAGPAIVARLEREGVRFDRDPAGALALGLEAAHGRRRIVHAEGDSTGAAIVRALAARVRAETRITVLERARLLRIEADGSVAAVHLRIGDRALRIPTRAVVLATGGAGALFADTTNPLGATGSGLAAAARAGAVLGDLEFVQFHPTALAAGPANAGPLPLVSEAVRGEGAILVDERGDRFTDELAPRDVVSRAVWRHLADGHAVFLDARPALGDRFAARFPGIDRLCRAAGIDPARQPIPIRPAAHYHMGGIVADASGRSSVPGLFAIGEASCTGLHGANRLASNSLLEAAAGAIAVAEALPDPIDPSGSAGITETAAPPPPDPVPDLRAVMTRAAGVLRDGPALEKAIRTLRPRAETHDAALVGLMLCQGALERRESRGGHFRTDHPERDPVPVRRTTEIRRALAAEPESIAP